MKSPRRSPISAHVQIKQFEKIAFTCTGSTLPSTTGAIGEEVVWARSAGHLVFIVALLGPGHGGWRLFETNNLPGERR